MPTKTATPAKTATTTPAAAPVKASPPVNGAAPAAKASPPAKAEVAQPALNLEALAAGVKEISELPKMAVGGARKGNAFTALVQRSADEGKPLQTPPVTAEQGLKVQDAIYRAAIALGLKVKTRRTISEDGTATVSFQAAREG